MRRQTVIRGIAALVISLHIFLLGYGAVWNSPALDEVAHLTAGLSHWEMQNFDLYRVNPPLVRTVAALPTYFSNAERDWSRYLAGHFDRPEFPVGADFIYRNGRQAFWHFTWARWMCVPFSLIGAWFCFRWSAQLFGSWAALLALTLWCFLPEVIGHGQMITPDVAAASLGLGFWYFLWRWYQAPSWKGAVTAGAWMALAVLAKTTWVINFPLLLVIALLGMRSIPWQQRWLQPLVMVVLSVYLINLAYLFEGTGTRLGEFPFISSTLAGQVSVSGNRFQGTWLGDIPVPLPKNLVLGIDVQKYEFGDRDYESYLRGEWRDHGWWHYYLYGVLIKTPLGALVLIAMALGFASKEKSIDRTRNVRFLLVPCVAVLLLVSSQTGFNHHMRYVLPAIPYLLILASGCITYAQELKPANARAVRSITVVSLCLFVTSSLFVFPFHHSYFNASIGGPNHGPRHLLNSNVDWGQDFHRIRHWAKSQASAPDGQFATKHLITKSNYDLRVAFPENGWTFENGSGIPRDAEFCIISVNELFGNLAILDALRRFEPTAQVGYSHRVYRAR